MKIAAMSDTHNRHEDIDLSRVVGCDMVIHSGDATIQGKKKELNRFLDWYAELPCKYKIFVPGNHDIGMQERQVSYTKKFAQRGVEVLIDSGTMVEDYYIWGMPWTPRFHDWAFNAARDLQDSVDYNKENGAMKVYPMMKDFVDKIPDHTNILVTHGPCRDILDSVTRRYWDTEQNKVVDYEEHLGCDNLYKRVKEIKPDVHIFGHIHGGYGEKHVDGTSFYNAAICDEMYHPSNSVHIIEL